MRGNKLHVDQTKKESQAPRAYAKGGATKMFREQAAGPAKSGQTGKAQTSAPGAKGARGGAAKMAPFRCLFTAQEISLFLKLGGTIALLTFLRLALPLDGALHWVRTTPARRFQRADCSRRCAG
jgi:hypothetical protein